METISPLSLSSPGTTGRLWKLRRRQFVQDRIQSIMTNKQDQQDNEESPQELANRAISRLEIARATIQDIWNAGRKSTSKPIKPKEKQVNNVFFTQFMIMVGCVTTRGGARLGGE